MQKGRGREAVRESRREGKRDRREEGQKVRREQHVRQCKRQWIKVEIKCKIVHAINSWELSIT